MAPPASRSGPARGAAYSDGDAQRRRPSFSSVERGCVFRGRSAPFTSRPFLYPPPIRWFHPFLMPRLGAPPTPVKTDTHTPPPRSRPDHSPPWSTLPHLTGQAPPPAPPAGLAPTDPRSRPQVVRFPTTGRPLADRRSSGSRPQLARVPDRRSSGFRPQAGCSTIAGCGRGTCRLRRWLARAQRPTIGTDAGQRPQAHSAPRTPTTTGKHTSPITRVGLASHHATSRADLATSVAAAGPTACTLSIPARRLPPARF